MTLQIELSPAAERSLGQRASLRGQTPEEYVKSLIERDLPVAALVATAPPDDTTLELFAKWDAEDQTDDPQEIARRAREFEAFRQAVNETREQAGARKIYP